jgi:hypothetical protein
MSQFSTSSQNPTQDKAACLSCGLWALLGERRICDECVSDELGEDDPCFSFLDKAFSNLLVAGYTIPEACTRIHQAMVTLAHQHGFQTPVWPHDFPQAELSSSAINFGDDVNTAPTSPAVPVGNTGTTSTGRVL